VSDVQYTYRDEQLHNSHSHPCSWFVAQPDIEKLTDLLSVEVSSSGMDPLPVAMLLLNNKAISLNFCCCYCYCYPSFILSTSLTIFHFLLFYSTFLNSAIRLGDIVLSCSSDAIKICSHCCWYYYKFVEESCYFYNIYRQEYYYW
jgi:hypothetical protein